MYKKTHVVFFISCNFIFSPNVCPGLCQHCLWALAGPGLGPSIKTGLGPSKKGRDWVGLASGLGLDPSLGIHKPNLI